MLKEKVLIFITIVVRRPVTGGLVADIKPKAEGKVGLVEPAKNKMPGVKQVTHLPNKVTIRPAFNAGGSDQATY